MMMTQKKVSIQPLGDRVLVEVIKEDTKTASGIILPESKSSDRAQRGVVVAVGDLKEVTNIQEGDIVLYGGFSHESVTHDKKEYVILESKNVLAVVNK